MTASVEMRSVEELQKENVLLRDEVMAARKASDVKNTVIEEQFKKVDAMLTQLEEKAKKEHELVQRLEDELRISEDRKQELDKARIAAEQSLAVLKQTQNSLVESEEMAAVGDLIAGVARGINTPLSTGVSAASRLQRTLKDLIAEYKASAGAVRRANFDKFISTAQETLDTTIMSLSRATELVAHFKTNETFDDTKTNLHRAAELIASFQEPMRPRPGEAPQLSHVNGMLSGTETGMKSGRAAGPIYADNGAFSVVYKKTEKGIEEIKTRKYNLPQKLRYILIVIDGKMTKRVLFNLYSNMDGLAQALDELEKQGFITL